MSQLLGGGHVMLSTPTASGKSLAYNLPVLHAMASDPDARAIYIFPTKALAQDQLRALRYAHSNTTKLVVSYEGVLPTRPPLALILV